jgi:Plavaka transposase
VEQIPERAGDWMTKTFSFKDHPGFDHTIHYRNPIESIKSLWADPALSQDIVFRPTKVFSDSTQQNHIFSEMWTSKWWHALQVSGHTKRI